MLQKPTFEKITPDFGSSITAVQKTKKRKRSDAFWHFHPEIELVYVNKGKGKRHIGSHLSYFNNSQLILIGSNLPHNGFTDRLTSKGKETLIQFRPEFLGDQFFNIPEMASIAILLEKAKKGILFKPETKKIVGPKIEKLPKHNGPKRVIKLLEILHLLSQAKDYVILNADGYAFETQPQDSLKIDKIFKHINANFQNHISLEEVADQVSMTVPAFCRYFKKATGKTFTQLVNEYRVVHATKLLLESKISITDICFESGFNNFSHFNKIFKENTGKSASHYRSEMQHLIG
ncbi:MULTISPECIES: AraC family transcriptional regulator [Mesoflavibacter]|uniref:AraC family transcriptional regulator n=1 Tax=Mesoflavibacter profundi TaxID=2708110 RepID=A0ABT4S170_9FLAO|nr:MULTISPECIES: AraC family transcriptional regulator [Mesoflavibacter]MDA0177821.1 AraC family transcriptional regulator [Mesoflavibacter profundi]QIJ88782.1 Transcriptional regulator [Mesoflavibacter sp. HG96]QIJ91510.1 Transcriptional regulator [Mesoflavibacter sp. HG37]